nr:serine/threonine-protein phosphatase 7 long form homolog [Ipomoea batatas]
MAYIQLAGFDGLSRLERIHLDWPLITAMVERWRPETHCFQLPFGEVTITLQDVEVLLGLRIDGMAMTSVQTRTKNEWCDICHDLLGIRPNDHHVSSIPFAAPCLYLSSLSRSSANNSNGELRWQQTSENRRPSPVPAVQAGGGDGNKARDAHLVCKAAKGNGISLPQSSVNLLIKSLCDKDEDVYSALEMVQEFSQDERKHAIYSFSSVIQGLCRPKDDGKRRHIEAKTFKRPKFCS